MACVPPSGTPVTPPFAPHWHIGGVFLIAAGALATGWLLMSAGARLAPRYFARTPQGEGGGDRGED
ncbi:hypothetical protein ACF1AX_15475 [Streptomyces sp. NPDC014802]|uniref:hypothetical protein n=1 Tax=Streptomyces sp. NPDC014802 TaxID=3364917 RepID=UPI0037007767